MRPHLHIAIGALTLASLATLWSPSTALANTEQPNMDPAPAKLMVKGTLSTPAAGVTDLKFGEMFKMPVGPKGLEPSDKLSTLSGQRVRMVGYVANAEEPTPGLLILSPLPVVLGDEDEKLVDDLPPTAVFVHLSSAYAKQATPNYSGLVQLTGRLEVGAQEEADGHVSATRLVLDDATSRLLTTPAKGKHAARPKH
ncbi:MAG: hypothetical protein KGL57_07885 [Burkholderiales bacterium]|nr:hypothetical protein [Burkholderiales bacterium]